jgi:hypothetical protein
MTTETIECWAILEPNGKILHRRRGDNVSFPMIRLSRKEAESELAYMKPNSKVVRVKCTIEVVEEKDANS